MPEGYSPSPERHAILKPEHEHFRFRKAAAIVAGAGVLFLPIACTDSAEHPSPEAATTDATPAVLPEDAYYIEHSINYNGEIDKTDPTPLLGQPDNLGYALDDQGYPDVEYQMVESGSLKGVSYLPLAEITMGKDGLILEDVSPLGLPEETMVWLGDRFINQSEIVSESLESGSTKKYTVALQDDTYDDSMRPLETGYISGFYDRDAGNVVVPFSTRATVIDPENFEQTVVHESAHSLFGDSPVSVFSKETPDESTRVEFAQACADLRMQSLQDTATRIYAVQSAIDRWAETQADPNMKARITALSNSMHDNSWWRAATQDLPEEKVDECTVPGLGFINRNLAEQLNLAKPAEGFRANDAEIEAFYEADSELVELLRESTLYSVLTEGTYFYEAPLMGHPQDGIDETAASAVNLVISFPDDMALKLKYLPEDQQQVVVRVIRNVIDQIVEHHPDLRGYLAQKEAYFMEQLHD